MPVKLINSKSAAFLICDLQEGFSKHIYAFDDVVKTTSKMIEAAKVLDLPILVTEQNPEKLGKTVSELDISEAKIVQPKMRFSMIVPEIEQKLRELDRSIIILVGIESHVCVLQTALELQEKHYDVHILADGVSSVNKGEIEIALTRARDAGVIVTTSESVLFQLMKDASHPQFRTISKLVRDRKEDTKKTLESLVLNRSSL